MQSQVPKGKELTSAGDPYGLYVPISVQTCLPGMVPEPPENRATTLPGLKTLP